MKKIPIVLACLAAPGIAGAAEAVSSNAYKFTSRSIMNISQTMPTDPMMYHVLNDHFIYDREEVEHTKLKEKMKHLGKEAKSYLNIMAWGGATTNATNIARYLLPFGKTQLLVREGYQGTTNPSVDTINNQDIVAENFNIVTKQGNFCSVLDFKPKQTFAGVGFNGYFQISNTFWVAFELPVIHVKNNLDFVETVTFAGGGPVVPSADPATEGFDNTPFVGSMTAAFQNPNMKYGRIDGSQDHTAVAYVNLKVGYTYLYEPDRSLQVYGGVVLPTGNKPKSIYLFEPLVGNNKHFGVILGSMFTRQFQTKRFAVDILVDSNTQFLFPNTQVRSIDLAGKPWSRYLGIYADNKQRLLDEANGSGFSEMRYQTWGINFFTQEVNVNPHFSTDLVFNFSFELPRNGAFDLGFRCFWQQDEHVTLKNPWLPTPIIGKLSDASVASAGGGECVPARGINDMFSNFTDSLANAPIYITQPQLDLESCSQPFRSDYTMYAALHRFFDMKKIKGCGLQVGTSFTYASNDASANRWAVWIVASRLF